MNYFHELLSNKIMKNGYPSHFIIGALIGFLIFHYVYKKTANMVKSWIIAVFIVSAIGLVKELIDPHFWRQRDKIDLVVTILGGIIGVGIVVLFKKNKTK